MIRGNKNGVLDAGPRSAHIAGMDYAVFTPEEEIVDPKIEFFSPKEGDPNDYIAIRLKSGKRITITNTSINIKFCLSSVPESKSITLGPTHK